MIKGFICPDGTKISFNRCFRYCTNRCVTLPTLMFIHEHMRPWKGYPSVTQLLKGTRQAYLELTRDYYISPKDMAFSLLGTAVHLQLSNKKRFMSLMEEEMFLTIDDSMLIEITGTPDLYDRKNKSLYDYKVSGSYAIASAKESGKKEWTYQLNAYRIALEQSGYPVENMYIQAITRDGGLYTARQNGIENIEIIPIEFIDNNIILEFYRERYKALITAIETGQTPPPCSDEETWNGKKCKYYCPVLEYCPEGQKRAENIA